MSTTSVLAETIDPSSDRAVYKQIADHLRAAIGNGGCARATSCPLRRS
jgi:DNA-binding transcriptional regulator YhcF (GntR family)